MNEKELDQLHILTTNAAVPEIVKDDLHVFFSSLDPEEISGVLNLCREDPDNLVLIARLLERRKEALIQNDAKTWEEVLSYEHELVEQELQRNKSS